jgi:L-threonylcarbamoyladenylate synthase
VEIIRIVEPFEIKKAAKALKNGCLVIFPTETVYGLGADATNSKAVHRVYAVKSRPTDHPLIIHISSIDQIGKWAINVPDYALKLARKFWPGPLTLILKKSDLAMDFVTGGQGNVGLRVPNHPIALALTHEFEKLGGAGIAAPSANKFGAVSATTCAGALKEIGEFLSSGDLVLDGQQSMIGIESTIIDCTNPRPIILRPGYVTNAQIEATSELGIQLNKNKIKVSGNLESHYSPKAKVVLDSTATFGDGFIAMANIPTPVGAIRLASPTTVEEFARDLYQSLRLGDEKKLDKIIVFQPTGIGLAMAIRDRLFKASHNKNSSLNKSL